MPITATSPPMYPQGLLLVEEKVLAANATTWDFSATLDGDTDKIYFFEGSIVWNELTSTVAQLRVNGGMATGYAENINANNASLSCGRYSATAIASCASQAIATFSCWIFAASNPHKSYLTACQSNDTAGPTTMLFTNFGVITTAGNITSLGLFASEANKFGIGSKFRLYKMKV